MYIKLVGVTQPLTIYIIIRLTSGNKGDSAYFHVGNSLSAELLQPLAQKNTRRQRGASADLKCCKITFSNGTP